MLLKQVCLAAILCLWTTPGFSFYTQRPKNFFIMESEGYHINKSYFTKPESFTNQQISTDILHSTISWNHMIKPHTGLRLEIGQEYIHLGWKNSPEFRRTGYNAFLFNLGCFTDKWENWWILSQLGIATDMANVKIKDYTQMRFVLYTRYNYRQHFRLHFGFLGSLGFRHNRVVPIIGIDFSQFKHFKINLVFPTNLSLVWEYNPTLSAILRYRFIQFARRFDPDDIRPKGAFLYNNQSIELAFRAIIKELFSFQVFGGWAVGDKLRIESRNGADLTYYYFKSGFLYGAGLFVVF